jgi:hypothetical protein
MFVYIMLVWMLDLWTWKREKKKKTFIDQSLEIIIWYLLFPCFHRILLLLSNETCINLAMLFQLKNQRKWIKIPGKIMLMLISPTNESHKFIMCRVSLCFREPNSSTKCSWGLAGFNQGKWQNWAMLLKSTVAQSERREILKHEIHDLI